MDQNQLALLITLLASGLVVIIVLGVVLYFFVFSKIRVRNQIREIQRKYSYLDALLIGQDSQYIHRIEIISRTNLLYVEKHEYFTSKFKDIYENDDRYVDSLIKQLNLLVANNQYKNIKVSIIETRKALETFERSANALDKELYSLIKLEEESRQNILKYKENYRRIKQIYFNSSASIEMVANSMNQVFAKLDDLFLRYDTHIDGAEYDEASSLIPTISKVLLAIEQVLVVIPDLCVLVEDILPKKIKEVSEEYDKALATGLPLQHLLFKSQIGSWNSRLKKLKTQLTSLQIKSVKEEINKIQDEILDVHNAINEEIKDKEEFDTNLKGMYSNCVELENQFIKLCSLIPHLKGIYSFSEDRLNKNEELRESVNKLTTARNSLDNYIHSALKQPYSALNNKLNEVSEEYNNAKARMEEFKAFVESLKTYTEEAYNLIFIYYYRTKQIEHLIRTIDIEVVKDNYSDKIKECYDYINDVDMALKEKPINVEALNSKVEQLKSYANALFDQIENDYRECQLAESAFVYANRDRQNQNEVNSQLQRLEKLFFQGEFDTVYQEANTLFRRSHIEDTDVN